MSGLQKHEELEKVWAELNGLDPKGMVACSSGTAALHLAFESVMAPDSGRRVGYEVVMPDYSMVACARAATLAGMQVSFVDCLPATLVMDVTKVRGLPYQPIVLAVHVHGRVVDMLGLYKHLSYQGKTVMWVIEDLAEAHGVQPDPMTDAACWSFYKNKIVAGEEGGAVWFRDPEHADLARQLRCQGFTPDHDYTHIPRGHNYRLAPSLADAVLEGIDTWSDNLLARRVIEAEYDVECPSEWRMPPRQAPWVYDLRIRGMKKEKQREVVTSLQREGIAARYGFKPLSWQEEYRTMGLGDPRVVARESSRAAYEVISLPLHPSTSPETPRRAFELLRGLVEGS